VLAKQVLDQLSYTGGWQEKWQKTFSHASIRRTSNPPSTRRARKRLLAHSSLHPGVLEEGWSLQEEDYAATLTPSLARCLARVRELTINAKPSRSRFK
jgi:hypothetical protein